MSTIFPAPGTITSNNSYIVNWYIYEPAYLRYPTVVKQRTTTFADIPDAGNTATPPACISKFKVSNTTSIQRDVSTNILDNYDSSIAGDYRFDVSTQSLIYSTENTSTVNWYINDENIITYTTKVATTLSLYFKNYTDNIPFKTNSVVRISNYNTNYSKTFTVIAGFINSVIIESDNFDAAGLVIDNIKSSVGRQLNTFKELSIASLPRKNLLFSTMAPGAAGTNVMVPPQLPGINIQQPVASLKSVNKLQTVLTPSTPTTITRYSVKSIITTTLPDNVEQLSQYNSDISGEYRYNITNQTLIQATVGTDTRDWYVFDNLFLTYSLSNKETITIYFDNTALFVPFKTGSLVRITNPYTGFSNISTVLEGKQNFVTIDSIIFDTTGAMIDGIVNSLARQDLITQEYSTASIPRKNLLSATVAPTFNPSISFKFPYDYATVKDTFITELVDNPLHKLSTVDVSVTSAIITKFKTSVEEEVDVRTATSLNTHDAPLTGEFAFTIIETSPIKFKTVNTSTVDWLLYDQDILTYSTVEYTGNITVYFNNPYVAFIPFKIGSLVKISNPFNFSNRYTVLDATINSVTIDADEIPFFATIDNITETVYNQTYTHLLQSPSNSQKRLYSLALAPGLSAPTLDSFNTSMTEPDLSSGKISRELNPVADISTNIESATVSKQLFTVKPVVVNQDVAKVTTYLAKDFVTSNVDNSNSLTPYDELEDGVVSNVLGQPIEYNVVSWYINEYNILTGVAVSNPTITLHFKNTNVWKLFLVNQYVRIKQPNENFVMDVLVTDVTNDSITFDNIVGFPSNYSGMTISHLYSAVYAQSLVSVDINPPNLSLPRENLAAGSNSLFVNMFPIGRTVYNSRGVLIGNPTVIYASVELPSTISLLNTQNGSSVLPQATFDQQFSNVFNPTDLTQPQQNLALLSNTSFLRLFPIGRMYNTRGVSAFDVFRTVGDAAPLDITPSLLTPYEVIEDGLVIGVTGQPIFYDVVGWYINDNDILTGTPVSGATITLVYNHSAPGNPFINPQLVRIKQESVNFSADVMITSSTGSSITFDSIPGFPTNYSGMKIYRLNSPVFFQKDVHVEFKPYDLTLPRENLAASLLKPNLNGTYVSYIKSESLNGTIIPNERGRLEIFDDIKIPGDFDRIGVVTTLPSFTTNTNTVSWYQYDQDTLSYTISTNSNIKIEFSALEFIPFETGSFVKLVSNTTIVKQVIFGSTSYVIVEYQPDFSWHNIRIQSEVASVYPLDYASTTVNPASPREILYYLRIRNTVPLSFVFDGNNIPPGPGGTISNPLITLKDAVGDNIKLTIEQLSNASIIKGETSNWDSGLLSKFTVSKISEIGRETVITIPVSTIMPIQFWN